MSDKQDPAEIITEKIWYAIAECPHCNAFGFLNGGKIRCDVCGGTGAAITKPKFMAIIREAYAEQQKEIDTSLAAIATPEVYAGVITKIVEDERDEALRQLVECRKREGAKEMSIEPRAKRKDFHNGQLLKALYLQNNEQVRLDCSGVLEICIVMEAGQMDGTPWALVTNKTGDNQKFNLALVEGVELFEKAKEPQNGTN